MKSELGAAAPSRRGVLKMTAALAVAYAVAVAPLPASRAAEDGDVAAASSRLFAAMSARNLQGVMDVIPAQGFTEVSPDSNEVRRLDAKAFEGLFKSGMAINLRMTGMQVQMLGDVAIVTGTRVGSITPPGNTSVEERQLATLVWSKPGGQWRLQHIHLSALSAAK